MSPPTDVLQYGDAVDAGAEARLVEDEADGERRDGSGVAASVGHGLGVVVGVAGDDQGGVVSPQQLVLGPAAAAVPTGWRWGQVGVAVVALADVVAGVRVGGGVGLLRRHSSGECGDRGCVDADGAVPVLCQVLLDRGDRCLENAVADPGESLSMLSQQFGVCGLEVCLGLFGGQTPVLGQWRGIQGCNDGAEEAQDDAVSGLEPVGVVGSIR
jgi:hypothetical protein